MPDTRPGTGLPAAPQGPPTRMGSRRLTSADARGTVPGMARDASLPIARHLWLAAAVFLALALAFIGLLRAHGQVDAAHETRHQSFVLADALRQSSDDLTRMVRTYVATGDTRYKQAYLDILAIRDGELPPPPGYERVHWDLVLVGAVALGPTPPPGALLERMRQAGFSADEFKLLAQAKANSDALTRTEKLAMALVEDAHGDANGADPATRARAVAMLHDQRYHDAKASVMRPLNDFIALSSGRTSAMLADAQRHARRVQWLMAALGALLLLALWWARRSLVTVLGAPLEQVRERLAGLAQGRPLPDGAGPAAAEGTVLAHVQRTERALAALDQERRDSDRQRSQAEAALRNSEARLRAITDNTSAVIFLKDLQGRYLHINRRYEELFHVRREDLIGRTDHDLFPPEMADAFVANDREAAHAGRSLTVEEQVPQDDGLHTYVAVKFPLRDGDDRVYAVCGIATDISERKRYEQRLESEVAARTAELRQAMEAAEQASRSKSAFLANMSHEIRTPLNAISGMAHLVREDGLNERQSDRLGKLETASQHLLALLNDVLDMAKIEAGKMTLQQAPVHVGEIVEQVMAMLAPRARAKGLELTSQVDELPGGLLGDATRLKQCLLNLADNAVKYSDAGRVALWVGATEQDERELTLRVEIHDQGVGIDDDTLQRLFQPFEQAGPVPGRSVGGSGLGLAITRRLAELMGGRSGATSEPGRGSTFWFSARLVRAGTETVSPGTHTREAALLALRQRHAGRGVLVAEDNLVNQEIMRAVLEQAALVPLVAADGAQAVQLAHQDAPALVLMDMRMPGMDGLQATHALRAAGMTMPIVAMTANAFAEDAQACRDAGMDDFVTKPVQLDDFLPRLLQWLDQAVPPAPDVTDRTGQA